ncbi:MAG: hypothetical protein QM539_03170 [Alphaproteobacteria bacterium]|nr:hypothetical protein [Alphaproteobacteria bacterium]
MKKFIYLIIIFGNLFFINCTKKITNGLELKIGPRPYTLFEILIFNKTKDTLKFEFGKDNLSNFQSNAIILPPDTFKYFDVKLEDTIFCCLLAEGGPLYKIYDFFDVLLDTSIYAEFPLKLYFGNKRVLNLKYQNLLSADINETKYKSIYNYYNYKAFDFFKYNRGDSTKPLPAIPSGWLRYDITEKDYLLADTIP